MYFSIEVNEFDIPNLFSRFVEIAGWKTWQSRILSLERQIKDNPFLAAFINDKHSLELTFGKTLYYKKIKGKFPIKSFSIEQYELYAFVTTTVRVYESLSPAGKKRLKGMIIDGLKDDKGLIPLQHEMTTATHLMSRGFNVVFNDIELGGGFDFLAAKDDIEIEVECKSINGDLGRKIIRKHVLAVASVINPTLRNILTKIPQSTGKIVRIIMPSRSSGNHELLRNIRDCIEESLKGSLPVVSFKDFSVKLDSFNFEKSPFFERYDSLNKNKIEQFNNVHFGKPDPHLIIYCAPKKGAILITLESQEKDSVLNILIRNLKDSSKNQFTKTRASILSVQLYDLSSDQLLNIAQDTGKNKSGLENITGIQIATSNFLQSESHNHIYAIVYTSHSNLYKNQTVSGIFLPNTIQAHGPAYVFYNPNHPNINDQKFRIYSLDHK